MKTFKNTKITAELTFIDGTKHIMVINPFLVYNLKETVYRKLIFTWKPPFIKISKKPCVCFRLYEGKFLNNSRTEVDKSMDEYASYSVDCNMSAFLNIIGESENVVRWTQKMIETDIKYGKHD